MFLLKKTVHLTVCLQIKTGHMDLLSVFNLPVTDPTWIFLIVLIIILFAPLLLGRLRIPHIIGMILAGVAVGEFGFNILERDSSFELFGRVGLFYIMFLAGLEMDLEDFRKNKVKGLVFGILTFTIPMALGIWSSMSLLDYSLTTSILLASMYASHTLVAYPIVSRYGLARQRSVNITIGGTVITVTLALIILAVISGMYKGTSDGLYWLLLFINVVLISLLIVFCFPMLGRWFFRKYDDPVMQFVFVLAMVFLGGGLMSLAGMEGILGAFLVGIVLNPLIPRVSPLMNRLEFVGNALFIPYFLIGVGMIIDVRTLFAGGTALKVAVVMTVVATLSKWLAAWGTQKMFGMSRDERGMMFGLSNAQAAATLAAVLVGHGIIMENGERLLNDDVLNGTVVMILFTCIISSLVTDWSGRKLATGGQPSGTEVRDNSKERILIPIANPDTIENLINLALVIMKPRAGGDFVALNVTVDSDNAGDRAASGRRGLEKAAQIAAAADVSLSMVSRYDISISTGIIHTLKEYSATDIVLGLHQKTGFLDSFFGALTSNLLRGTSVEVIVARLTIPVNTLKAIHVIVPPRAEYEAGFSRWMGHLGRMSGQLGCRISFISENVTMEQIRKKASYYGFGTSSRFLPVERLSLQEQMSAEMKPEDILVVVSARSGSISYNPVLDKLPQLLLRNQSIGNFIILYPEQVDMEDMVSFSDPMGNS